MSGLFDVHHYLGNTHALQVAVKMADHFEKRLAALSPDYYERALYIHLLATMDPDSGAMTYFIPLFGNFRTYLDGTFCCTGTGIENPPRYNEGIYF